ncbi:hypothetical protein [Microbacterium sp. MYb62]|uniref:hypothetical protein n=1 Tax=Microbacterium sp. MYb62 TaxID=1848690 RepID=UPI000CFD75EA|nr:hypothetical protein [Microbacterium sp. MYb62]PRB18479.1 hypothetical protein CQ042_04120 [Microbacterium sp. MYb62]
MTFTPLRSRSRDLSSWFATRPDLFVSERSPRRSTTWLLIAALMVILMVVVYASPDATVALLGGRVRSGLAIGGAFFLPPTVFAASIAMFFIGTRRWRVKGGGALTNPVVHGVAAGFPLDQATAALQRGSSDIAGIVDALKTVIAHRGDDRLLTIWTSESDRAMYIGVIRVDGKKLWIDSEPVPVDPALVFDVKELDRAALREHAGLDRPRTDRR